MKNEEEKSHIFSKLEQDEQNGAERQSAELSAKESASPSDELTASEAATTARDAEQACVEKKDEFQALQDKYLRLAAEFENYKRLAQRDQREHARFANESVLKDLLPILDNLERAIKFSKDNASHNGLIQGVELTLKQFMETLARFGVQPITSVGGMFDPSRHQAVTKVASPEAAENTVVEEYQKGYLLHERVLRAAMVAVAAAPKESSESSDQDPNASH